MQRKNVSVFSTSLLRNRTLRRVLFEICVRVENIYSSMRGLFVFSGHLNVVCKNAEPLKKQFLFAIFFFFRIPECEKGI